MIKIDFNDEDKKCDISFTGTADHVCNEMAVALDVLKKIMAKRLGDEEAEQRFKDIVRGFVGDGFQADVSAMVEGMERTVTEK